MFVVILCGLAGRPLWGCCINGSRPPPAATYPVAMLTVAGDSEIADPLWRAGHRSV